MPDLDDREDDDILRANIIGFILAVLVLGSAFLLFYFGVLGDG